MLKMRVVLLCSLLCNIVQNRSVTSVDIQPKGPVQDIDLIKNENSTLTRSRQPQNSIAIHAEERRNGQQISSFAKDVNLRVKGSNFSALIETLVWKTHPAITGTRSTQDSKKSGGKNLPFLPNLRRTINRDSQRADDNQRANLTHGSKSGDLLRQNNEITTVGREAERRPDNSAKTGEHTNLHRVTRRATPHDERQHEVDGRTDNGRERGQHTNAVRQESPSAAVQGASQPFTAVTDPKPSPAEMSSYGQEEETEEKRSREARSFDAGSEVTVDAPSFGLVDVVVSVGAASEVRRKLTGPSATEQGYRSKGNQLDPLSVQTWQDAPPFPCVTCSSFFSSRPLARFAPGKSKSTIALAQHGDGTVTFPAASHLPTPPGASKEKIFSSSIASFHAGKFIGAKEENIPLGVSTQEETERGRVVLIWLRTATKEYSPEGSDGISMVGDKMTKGQAGRSLVPSIAADVFKPEEANIGEKDTTTGFRQVQSPKKMDLQSSLNVDTKTILPDSYKREMYHGVPYVEYSLSNNRNLIRNKFTPFVSLPGIPAVVQHREHPYNTNNENALTRDEGRRLSFHYYVPRKLSPLLLGPTAMIDPATTATLMAAEVSQESSDVGPNQRSRVVGEGSGSDATNKGATKSNQARAAIKIQADDHGAVTDPARVQPDSPLNTNKDKSWLFDAERLANGSLAVKNQGRFHSAAEKRSLLFPTESEAKTHVANLSRGDSLQSLAGARFDPHSIVNTGRQRRSVDSETVNGSGEEDNTSKIKMVGNSDVTLTSSQTTITIVLATVEGGNKEIKDNSLTDHYDFASVTNSDKNDDASSEHMMAPSTTAHDAPTSSTDSGTSKLQEADLSSLASTLSVPFSSDNLVTPLDTDSPTMSQTQWPVTPEHSYTDPAALSSSASATDGAVIKQESSTTTQLTTTANVEKPNTKNSTTTDTSEDSTSATTSATDSAAQGTASQPQPRHQPGMVDAQVSDLAAKVTSPATASTAASTSFGHSLVTSTTTTTTATPVTATETSATSTAASPGSDATMASSTLQFISMSTTAEAELLPELESGYPDPDPDPDAEGEDVEAGGEQEKGSESKGKDWQLPKSDERVSVWDTIKAAHYGVWWQVHIYALAAFFWLLAVYSLVCLLRLWHVKRLLPGLHFLVVHLLALTLCGSRVAYLTVAEGYNRAGTLHVSLDYFLYSAPFPCLSAAFGLLVLSLFRAARGRLLTQSDHKETWLAVIVVAHFALTVATAVVVGMTAGMRILLLVCQLFFILWGSFLFLGYVIIFRRLYVHALKRQMACEQTAISGTCVVGRSVKSRLTLGVAVKVTLLTAVLGLVMVGMEVYRVVGVYRTARLVSGDPQWLCYLYHTTLRLLEVALCAALIYVASLPYRYQRVEKGGCCLTLCAPCVVMCCCCCRDADDTGPKVDPADRPDVDNHHTNHFQQQQQLGDASQSEGPSCAISLNMEKKMSWQKPLIKKSSQGKADGIGYFRQKPGDVTPIVGTTSDSRLTSDSEERTTSTRGSPTSGGAAEEEREISTPLLAATSPYRNAYPSDRVTALLSDPETAGDQSFWALENSIGMNNNCLKSGEGSRSASTGGAEAGAGSRPRFSSCGSSDLYIPPPGTLTLADSMDQELDRAFQSMHEADASQYLPMSRDGPADSPPSLPQPQTPVRCPDRTPDRQGATTGELSREKGGNDASGLSVVPCFSSTPRRFTDYDSKANAQKPLSDNGETTAKGNNRKMAPPPKPRSVSEQLTRVELQPQQEGSENQARSDGVCRDTDGGSKGSDVNRPAPRSSAGHSVAVHDGILDTVRDRSATAVDASHKPVSTSWSKSQAEEACDLRDLKPQHNDGASVQSSTNLSNKDNVIFGDLASEWFSGGSVSQPNLNNSGIQSQNSDVSKRNAYQTSGHLRSDRTVAAKGDDLGRFDNFVSQELSARAFPSRPKAAEAGGAAIFFTEDSDEIEV